MDITVLELHLPEAQFNAPFSSRGADDDHLGDERRDEELEFGTESGNGGRSGLVVLVVLTGLAALAWYLRSGRVVPEDVEPEESVARGHA